MIIAYQDFTEVVCKMRSDHLLTKSYSDHVSSHLQQQVAHFHLPTHV